MEIAKMIEVNLFVIDIGLTDCDGIDRVKTIPKTYLYQSIIIES